MNKIGIIGKQYMLLLSGTDCFYRKQTGQLSVFSVKHKKMFIHPISINPQQFRRAHSGKYNLFPKSDFQYRKYEHSANHIKNKKTKKRGNTVSHLPWQNAGCTYY